MTLTGKPAPISFKPDLEEAAKRWEAFYAGEIIDRPVLRITAPKEGARRVKGAGYRERVFGDLDDVIERDIINAEALFYGGEAIPTLNPSFGPDEVAVFTGAELQWSSDSPDTNWSVPYVEKWEDILPLRLQTEHPLWQRMVEFYRKAGEATAGKMLVQMLDLHTNMDLLSAIRGPERLCFDLIEQPEMIDKAMESARAIFPRLWYPLAEAAKMDERGYSHIVYSMEGAAVLQCDFSYMISPEMFRRWVLPALEEEAEIVKHNMYHWDGPGALNHTEDLIASKGLTLLSYVTGAGHGSHIDHLDLLKRVQAGGKAVEVSGTPDQLKIMHRELKPEKVVYSTWTSSQAEAEELLKWFEKNT